MKEAKTINVDGKSYTVNPFMTSQGIKLLTDIFVLAGEPLISLAVSLKDHKGSIGEADVTPEKISAIMMGLTAKMGTETLDVLFKRILEGTLVGSTSQTCASVYDIHFMGDYMHLFKVVAFSLKEQFGGFFGGLGGLANFAKAVNLK